jgi:hypothetical protein
MVGRRGSPFVRPLYSIAAKLLCFQNRRDIVAAVLNFLPGPVRDWVEVQMPVRATVRVTPFAAIANKRPASTRCPS